jgi:hypothetical protein
MTTPEWNWPDELDALRAAPQYHTLLLDNEQVRVLDTRIRPGEKVPLHTHRWPSVYYILSAGDFVRRDSAGNVLVDTRLAPKTQPSRSATWSAPLPPHTLENVGVTEIHILSVELKHA